MPKSRKQRTRVRKKPKSSARRRKTDQDIPVIPLLESTTEEETPRVTAVGRAVAEPVDELETKRVGSSTVTSEIKMEDFADVSEERASIISIVKDLEGQVDTAYELKEVLEAELDATKKKLSEELAAHTQLNAQVKSLKAQAALVDQLHEDISFTEEERDKFASLLADTQPQLEVMTEERDALSEKLASAEAQVKGLEGEKTTLEAQVMNLKDKVVDMDRLRGEVDNLRGKLTGADSRVADLHVQLEEQQAADRDLMDAKARLEQELKISNMNHEATKKELEKVKKALYDIRSEATLVRGRVRQRYSTKSKK